MSAKVYPLVAVNPSAVVKKTLHHVPPGADHCTVCGKHKLRMNFHYTEQTQVWEAFMAHPDADPIVGMWSVSDESVMPYIVCGREAEAALAEAEVMHHGERQH
jgi:hypothetical protein